MSNLSKRELNIAPEPKSSKAKKTRKRILEAARKVFAEKGFSKATAEEIATEAGVGYGTFYLYFVDKRQALHTIIHEVDDMLYHIGEEKENEIRGLGALPTIKATINGFFENFEQNADILKICQELSATDEDFKDDHNQIRSRLINRMKEHIIKGLKVGNARNVDPEIASVALAGLIETIANEWYFHGKQWNREEVVETISKLYFNAIVY